MWPRQARLFMNALILLQCRTCVFSHSDLAERECAEVIDYTSEELQGAQIHLCLSQCILAHRAVTLLINTVRLSQRGEFLCQILSNMTLNSWLGLFNFEQQDKKSEGENRYFLSNLYVSSTFIIWKTFVTSLLDTCEVSLLPRPSGEAL